MAGDEAREVGTSQEDRESQDMDNAQETYGQPEVLG